MARTILNIYAQRKYRVFYIIRLVEDVTKMNDTGYEKNTWKSQQSLTQICVYSYFDISDGVTLYYWITKHH